MLRYKTHSMRKFLFAGKARASARFPTVVEGLPSGIERYSQRMIRNFPPFVRTFSNASNFPTKFSELKSLDDNIKKALASAKIDTMTDIQSHTYQIAKDGVDVIGRAQTGTGKTLAFLLPSIQRALESPKPGQIQVLIVSPTRELAQQIHEQVDLLLRHFPQVKRQVMYGGTSRVNDIECIEEHGAPTVLTVTPGRLIDHLNSSSIGSTPFASFIQDADTLVLDEMDRLLGLGFRDNILEIIAFLPRERQTLLFSATSPPEVQKIISQCVKQDHSFIDCIEDENPETHIAKHIQQYHVVIPSKSCVTGVVQVIKKIMQEPKYKILVFFPTTAQVTYFTQLFRAGLGMTVLGIHSKLSQSLRTTTSDRFRYAENSVLFSSDVSARGVDYPGVTHVIQVGAASDRETYIHRLGRTARAGEKGKGVVLLSEHELSFLKQDLKDLDVPVHDKYQNIVRGRQSAYIQSELMRVAYEVRSGKAKSIRGSAIEAYTSLLGFYYNRFRSLGITSKDAIVDMVNQFASQAGLDVLPEISPMQAERFGLKGHHGLNIRQKWTAGTSFDVSGTRKSPKPRGVQRNERGSRRNLWGKKP